MPVRVRPRRDAARAGDAVSAEWWQAECARLRADLEATERARHAAEEERDAALELVAPDAVEAARQRDNRDAARLAKLATLQVALADAEADRDEARVALAAERARCAAVCRAVAARERGYGNVVGRCAAEICAEAIALGEVSR